MRTWIRFIIGLALCSPILAQEAPKPAEAPTAVAEETPAVTELDPALVTVGARAWEDGNVESIGDLLLPVYSTASGLLFLNPRSSFRGDENEVNLGAGVRQQLGDRPLILGVNAYYDRRNTEADNAFDQAGFGFECLGKWVDFRANYYLPEDDIEDASVVEAGAPYEYDDRRIDWGVPYAEGNTVLQDGIRTDSRVRARPYVKYVRQEQALEGFDAEVGVLLPIPVLRDWSDVKVFGGYYAFDNDLERTIEGWKGRLEVRALPSLLLDAELFEDDDLNDGKYYVGARLQAPFDVGAWASGRNPFAGTLAGFKPARRDANRPFSDRLNEMVIRDPRVQARVTEVRETVEWTVEELLRESRRRVQDRIRDNVVFVDGDNASGVEDGTAEHPFDTVGEGLATGSGFGNMVYVFDAGTPYRENVVIVEDGTTLVGSGTGLPANGGRRFATGRFPVLMRGPFDRKVAWRPSGILNVAADDVAISGLEFRGNVMGVLDDLKKPAPFPFFDELGALAEFIGDLSGIVALDADGLLVRDNRFIGNGIGLLALYTPETASEGHRIHALLAQDNHFEGNLAGMVVLGSDGGENGPTKCAQVPLVVGIRGNTFQDNFLGFGAVKTGQGGLMALVEDNTFDTDLPAGIGGVLVAAGDDLTAILQGNRLEGNHTLGFGILQEQGDLVALVRDNTIRDCQLASVLVEANSAGMLMDVLLKDEPRYDATVVFSGNTITGNGGGFDLPVFFKREDPELAGELPAVLMFLRGERVAVDISANTMSGNRGGALLAALIGEQNLTASIVDNGGTGNGGLFGNEDSGLEWERIFEGMKPMGDYSFLVCGSSDRPATVWHDNGFADSGDAGLFLLR